LPAEFAFDQISSLYIRREISNHPIKLPKKIKKVLTNGIGSGIIFGHPQKRGAGSTGPELKKKRVSSEL
jgi:hypothetical protein